MTAPDDDVGSRVTLTQDERALLVRACERHRRTIPVYMKAGQAELRLLEAVLAKLRASARDHG
ncbi:MAG: hypothetical protein AAGH15_24725 [Myxococcota bacterium]